MLREDIEYGKAGSVSLRMDAFVPAGSGPFPAVVLVHGGGWIAGHRRYSVEPLIRMVQDAGFAWFSISYRLATDLTLFGVAIEDVITAVKYIRSHAGEYRTDPERLGIIGESAGAHLATMAVLREGGARAVVCISGPTDLVKLAETSFEIPAQIQRALMGEPWGDMFRAGLRELSPVCHVRANLPPFLLVHGTRDPVVDYGHSEEFCRAVKRCGGTCELYPVEGAGHGIRWWEGNTRHTRYKTRVIDFLEEHLGGTSNGKRKAS